MKKPFLTPSEQVCLLESRGMHFHDARSAEKTLLIENYYSVINGYKDIFLESRDPEQYVSGMSFQHILDLFMFDRDLRLFFLPWIIQLEANLKSVIAHVSSGCYRDDPEFYLREDTYSLGTDASKKSSQRTISRLISLRERNSESLNHYREHVGHVPLWVLSNAMTFGDISYFYANLESQSLRNQIAKQYADAVDGGGGARERLTERRLVQYLRVLTEFRNVCAHDERFYCHVCRGVRSLGSGSANMGILISVMERLLSSGDVGIFVEGLSGRLANFSKHSDESSLILECVIDDMGVRDWLKGLAAK